MTTLAEFMIISGADNRPPMLEKSLYGSWKSRTKLYIENRENRRMILNLLQNGPLVWPTVVEEDGTTRTKKYEELSVAEKLQADCDLKATNISYQTSSVLPIAYNIPQSLTQPLTEFPQMDSGLDVLVFNQGDDPISYLNKAMAFLSAVASLSYKGNATSSGRNNVGGQARVVKCYNCQGEGHMARQCTQPKRPKNAAWFKEKEILAEAQEAGQILDEEQLVFLADPGIPNGKAAQTTIPNTVAFQTEDLDAYDSNCDDVSNAKAVLMVNLSNYGSDVISEVPHHELYHIDMDNQSVHTMQGFEETPVAAVQDTNLYAQQDSMILSVIEQMSEQMINHEKLALKQQIDSLEQNLSNQIKEKESLLQTFTVFKNESKQKESKYMDKEIDLEKKIKELDNIVYKVGQSAQTVHMLTKHKFFTMTLTNKALSQHAASPVIDDEETLILEELQTSHPNTDQSASSPVKIKAPKELPKCFEIHKKERFLENDLLLQKFMSQDVMICVMNSTAIFDDVDLEMQSSESCVKCLNLNAELLNKQNAYNDLSKSYSQLEKHCISLELTMQLNQEIFQKDSLSNNQNALEIPEYFENNNLKA
ncbi:retrovirus-related pol polyprotein from transposon TNT 1-94 [Tanacetum coccineum]